MRDSLPHPGKHPRPSNHDHLSLARWQTVPDREGDKRDSSEVKGDLDECLFERQRGVLRNATDPEVIG